MSVELTPEELGFRRPFDHEVTQVLKIANPNASTVAFKVKTTAPKQYCVRPNSGVVRANSTVDVQVLLQAMKEEPPLDARCRDKFLVQSVAIDDQEDDVEVSTLWSSIEKTNKASILEKKIKVQFLPASAPLQNGLAATHEEPPAYSSPASAYNSPAPAHHAATTTTSEKSPSSNAESAKSTVAQVAETTGIAGAAAAVANAVPTSQDQLQQQLSAAQAKIKELTNQLSDPQVRQRKVAEAQEKVQTVVQQSQESGVPLHITAGLCLLSFLIAWLFF